MSAQWVNDPDRRCIQIRLAFRIVSCLFIVSDVVTLLLPMPLIWRSSMSLARKLQLTCVFWVAAMVLVASIIKFYESVSSFSLFSAYLLSLLCTHCFSIEVFCDLAEPHDSKEAQMSQAAVAFNRALSTILQSVQAGVAVVTSCLPILPPIFRKWVYCSLDWSAPRRDSRVASSSGPVVWMQTIGGRKVAFTDSGVCVDYMSRLKVRPNGNAGSESTGQDSLELEHISYV